MHDKIVGNSHDRSAIENDISQCCKAENNIKVQRSRHFGREDMLVQILNQYTPKSPDPPYLHPKFPAKFENAVN